jgi:hypothetical protein
MTEKQQKEVLCSQSLHQPSWDFIPRCRSVKCSQPNVVMGYLCVVAG